MSGRGLPTSGTIKLSELADAYELGSYIGANTFTTANAMGTVTAPSGAKWCVIELYSGGGGGAGYYSGSLEYGGGGGGFVQLVVPVTAGVTTFGYRVGHGGLGGTTGTSGKAGGYSYANNIPTYSITGLSAIYCWSAGGGSSSAGGNGGYGDSAIRAQTANSHVTNWDTIEGNDGGTGTYYYGGDAAYNGGAGGKTSGAAGTAPGGGGAAAYLGGTGGAGAAGRVAFIWYGATTGTRRLRDYLRQSTKNPHSSSTGLSGAIPSSGTLKLRDFLGVSELGFSGNTVSIQGYYGSAIDWVTEPDTATANAQIQIYSNGKMKLSTGWMDKWFHSPYGNVGVSTTLAGYHQVQFTKTFGDTPTGSAVNTWITCTSEPQWWLNTTRSGIGTTSLQNSGYLRFRRTSDNVETVNVPMLMTSESTVEKETDGK